MNKKGFTLIEVTISIVLLSIVMVFMFKFLGLLRKDEDNVTIDTEMIILRNSLSKYLNQDVRESDGIKEISCCSNNSCVSCSNGNYDSIIIKLGNGKEKVLSYGKENDSYKIIKYVNNTDGIIEFKKEINSKYSFNPFEVKSLNDIFYLKAPVALNNKYDIDVVYGDASGIIDVPVIKTVSLKDAIIRDNKTVTQRTNLTVIYTENTTGTIFFINKTEDGSDVYYYAGNTANNWVKFGGFYWRIIRTNEDDSVRLLYAGTSPDTTDGVIGSSEYSSTSNNTMYVGYMYGTSGSLANNRLNTNDSTIKTYIDNWYKINLLSNYDKYISKSAIYCNDRSIGSGTYSSYGSSFSFGPLVRVFNTKTPTYKCGDSGRGVLFDGTQAVADKFSSSTTGGGNGKLKYPIAMITVDELVFAGGQYNSSLTSPYAWYYTNSEGNSITGTKLWRTMSPSSSSTSGFVGIWCIEGSNSKGNLGDCSISGSVGVRPVISLSSCVKVNGSGTPDDPYEVDEDGSTC